MRNLVFVVEDNPVQQKMLQFHFEETLGNYSVKAFDHPEEMMQHLREKPFAIVLDHFFGDTTAKTGIDYLLQLKKKAPSVAVIYYTSLNDPAVKTRVLEAGADQYIVKDSASLVRLRTALDELHARTSKKKNLLQRLFKL